jgi:cellulose synthase/poly-beta-1,6-N-acetylglucosamine synthase-like glycosyltransferase
VLSAAFEAFQWLALLYFAGINAGYIVLNIVTFFALPRHLQRRVLLDLPQPHNDFEPPISLIVPAYNEEAVIADSVRSLLQLDYSEFEIVVINDGSKDGTLEVLRREFDLAPFPEALRLRLRHQPVRAIYQSRLHPELRVIDKENGGCKSDAINAGINAARYPLFTPLDADTVLQRDSIRLLVQPFLEDPRTVATGGIVRIANGCEVTRGFLTRVGLPTEPLALVQIVEYLRAFLFGRVGWSALDALPLISGAFGMFRRESVVQLGGYRHDTLGEDMELVLRLHAHYRLQGRPYRVTFVPDPVCWTEAPTDLRTLRNQRSRWQRGLLESLWLNRTLFFHRRSGLLGWITLPFLLVFEGFGPIIEVGGYVVVALGFVLGAVSFTGFLAFTAVAVGLGTVLSLTSLLLEQATFNTYPRPRDLARLLAIAFAENLGYRQLTAVWRMQGLWRWARGSESGWGRMVRTASWAATEAAPAGASPAAGPRGHPAAAGARLEPRKAS